MQKKPIILIMTSRDEPNGISKKIASAIMEIGTHNAVIMSDDKYGSAVKLSTLDRLMQSGGEYEHLLDRAGKSTSNNRKFTLGGLSKRVVRIKNMIKRFRPAYILCVTPYAHHCAVEAKRILKSTISIIYMLTSFTVGKKSIDDETNAYIVDNQDLKAALVKAGVRSKNIMTMGMPFEIEKLDNVEIEITKQDMGLHRTSTVFVNISDKKSLVDIFSLLLDQGDIANLVVYCENPKLLQTLGNSAMNMPEVSVTFIKSREKIDEYLPLCNLLITDYNVSLIYKCMHLGIPPLIYTKDESKASDINYLVTNGLCLRAKEDIEIVGLEYKLLQGDMGKVISENGMKWTEFSTIENIANYLVSYIAV